VKVIQQARKIGGEVAEVEIAIVVVTVTVAASVPRNGVKVAAELGELIVPITPVAAYTVHQDNQRS
jgi:hypothetical protein